MTCAPNTPGPLLRRAIAELPLLVVAALLLSTGAEILPHDSLLSAGPVKLNLARVLVLVGLAALLFSERPRAPLLRSRLEIPLALLLAASLASTLKWSGSDPAFRFLVESVALFYLTVGVVRSRPEARAALLGVALVALALVAVPGVAEVAQDEATGFYRDGCVPVTQPGPVAPEGTLTRATGALDNPNVLAGYILLLAPLAAFGAALLTPIPRARLALWLLVALAYLAAVLTFSRGAVFFGLIAIGAGLLASRVPQRRYLAAVAVVLAGAALFLLAACGSEGTETFGRSDEWGETMEIIADNPVYGVGVGRSGDVLSARLDGADIRHPHNLFLTWWSEAGPLALLAWLWILGALLAWSLRAARRGEPGAAPLLVGLAGFTGFSLLDHPANVEDVATAFWIVAGIAVASLGTASRTPAERPDA